MTKIFELYAFFSSIFIFGFISTINRTCKTFVSWLDFSFSMEDGEKLFAVDRAKTGRAGCKKCKQKIESGALRIARVQPSPFGGDGSMMKAWHHVACFFAAQAKARATTKKIEQPDEDVQGWDDLTEEDRQEILAQMPPEVAKQAKKAPKSPAPAKKPSPVKSPSAKKSPTAIKSPEKKVASQQSNGEADFLYLRHSPGH